MFFKIGEKTIIIMCIIILTIIYSFLNHNEFEVENEFKVGDSNRLQNYNVSVDLNFVQVNGSSLYYNENKIKFEGINFYNWVSSGEKNQMIYSNHHSEIDFKRVSDMGFNTIRFLLNPNMFENENESYSEESFRWLDKNIEFAKNNNLFLILNLHILEDENYFVSWNNVDDRKKIINFWDKISKRYSDEPVIAGYDLLNEPWIELSFSEYSDAFSILIDVVRENDDKHIIIVEQLLGQIDGDKYLKLDLSESSFAKTNDSNTMYDFHFYNPNEFNLKFENSIDVKYPNEKLGFNKEYLELELLKYLNILNKLNRPINIGEIGLSTYVFYKRTEEDTLNPERWIYYPDSNGSGYLNDMIDLFDKYNLSYQYFDYHSPFFGIYYDYHTFPNLDDMSGLPSEEYRNNEVVKFFTNKLN